MGFDMAVGLSLGSGNRVHSDPYDMPASLPTPLIWFNPAKGGDGEVLTDFGSLGKDATQGTGAKQPTAGTAINGRPTLNFDGTDDAMTTASLDLSAHSQLTLVGVRTRTDTDVGDIVELSSNAAANNGCFYLFQNNISAGSLENGLRGTDTAANRTSPALPDATDVFVVVMDITAGTAAGAVPTFRSNGVDFAFASSGSAPAGTVFTAADILYIGSRAGTTLFAGMDLAELVILPGALNAQQISDYETSRNLLYI